jgi:hypothetical protein
MKKLILSPILAVALLLMNLSFQTYVNLYNFDHREVMNNIEYLASPVLKGRLAGTLENIIASRYIKSYFQKNNLEPYKGSYSQEFKVNYPKRKENSPFLRVVDSKGNIITEYVYGKDYKEDMLNFKKNSLSFGKGNPIYFSQDSIQVLSDNSPFLFFVPENDKLDFRSSFIHDSTFSMYIMITKDTLSDIKEHIKTGNRVECFIPYEIEETSLENIIGVIKGSNPNKPPVILSAHFDHIGTDLGNNIYAGALDNASGVAFIMEMSRYLKSLGTPERDIVFIAFNAEEFGCLGSKAFVDEHEEELKGSKVFNFDMIGSNNSVPLSIMGGKEDNNNSPLVRSASAACSSAKVSYSFLFEDASDHEYFRKKGIDAITFCDNDMSRIHTPEDLPAFISAASINRCFKVASREVIKYGYRNNFILIYPTEILLGSVICILGIILIHLITYKEQDYM